MSGLEQEQNRWTDTCKPRFPQLSSIESPGPAHRVDLGPSRPFGQREMHGPSALKSSSVGAKGRFCAEFILVLRQDENSEGHKLLRIVEGPLILSPAQPLCFLGTFSSNMLSRGVCLSISPDLEKMF